MCLLLYFLKEHYEKFQVILVNQSLERKDDECSLKELPALVLKEKSMENMMSLLWIKLFDCKLHELVIFDVHVK